MIVHVKFSALGESRWYEYLVRFVLGGLTTVVAGVIADLYGPQLGGLFLAFPAIFCASATLIEKHERQRKKKRGVAGQRREPMQRRLTPPAPLWAASVSLPLRWLCGYWRLNTVFPRSSSGQLHGSWSR
jgi:hypothetical protein